MYKQLTLLAVLCFFFACKNSSTNNPEQKGTSLELPQSTGPDASDLLKTLEGRWQSQDDSNATIEFADTKMRRFEQGVLNAEVDIEIDGACSTQPCLLDSTDLLDGWCFMEKGESGSACYIVLECNKEFLKYSPVATPKRVQVFKKL